MRLSGPLVKQVYEAMWAMLRAVGRHNRDSDDAGRIRVVACPGLGTATGAVKPDVAARLMAGAYDRHLKPKTVPDWRMLDKDR